MTINELRGIMALLFNAGESQTIGNVDRLLKEGKLFKDQYGWCLSAKPLWLIELEKERNHGISQ